MNVQPMPRDWHARALPRAKQQRAATLRRYVANLARLHDPDGGRHMLELGQELGVFCTEPGCVGQHHARGLCHTHYREQVGA